MTRPICEHGPPRRWKPERMIQWKGERGAWREYPRCQTFLLHKGLQCTQPARGEDLRFCQHHDSPVFTARNKRCLQCKIDRRARKSEPSSGREEFGRAFDAATFLTPAQEAEALRQWDISCSRGRTNRQAALALLADDLESFGVMTREIKAGQKEVAAGDLEAGAKRIIAAVRDYGPGLDLAEIKALARPEPIPTFGRLWPRTAVGELLTRLRGLEFKFLPSGADRREFNRRLTGPH